MISPMQHRLLDHADALGQLRRRAGGIVLAAIGLHERKDVESMVQLADDLADAIKAAEEEFEALRHDVSARENGQ